MRDVRPRGRVVEIIITVPDEVVARARAAGLNVSRLATTALIEELDRRSKIEALDAYLAGLEREFGPIPTDTQTATPSVTARTGPRGRRSA